MTVPHVGDRHPKTNFEAVDIAGRRYQVGCMKAFAAGISVAESRLGPTIDQEEIATFELDSSDRAEALSHNAKVVALALDISHGRTPATGLPA